MTILFWFQAFNHPGPSLVRPLRKSILRFAAAPPILAMVPQAVPAPIAAVFGGPPSAPGALPPAALPFLDSTDATMSQAEIGYLSRWYNNSFSIVLGDTHLVQLRKLRGFLSGF